MNATVVLAAISDQPIDVAELTAQTAHPAAGAQVTFNGMVRNHDAGQDVDSIEYTAHPQAPEIIVAIANDFAGRDGVHAITAVHRIGHLFIGDPALVVVVAAEHRSQAFAAISDLVDEVKRRLPVWKRQHFSSGAVEWSGLP